MQSPLYTAKRGALEYWDIVCLSGNPTGNETVTASLKPAIKRDVIPPDNVPVLQNFVVTFVPASGDELAYWRITLTPSMTINIPDGLYAADAKIVQSGQPLITEAIFIQFSGSITL